MRLASNPSIPSYAIIQVMRLLGVKLLIVTNAAGGLNKEYKVGDIMIIQDHFGMPGKFGQTSLKATFLIYIICFLSELFYR